MVKKHIQSNKSSPSQEVCNNNRDRQAPAAEEISFMAKLFKHYIPYFLLSLVVLIAVLAVAGHLMEDGTERDDDPWFPSLLGDAENSNNKGAADSVATNLFAVPSTCTSQQLYDKILQVYQNFTKVVDQTRGSTLNEWLRNTFEIDEHNQNAHSSKRGSKPMKRTEKANGEIVFEDTEPIKMSADDLKEPDRRFGGFVLELVRWLKNAKGFTESLDRHCTEKSLFGKVQVMMVQQSNQDNNHNNNNDNSNPDNQNEPEIAVVDVVQSKMLPTMYADFIALLKFLYSAPSVHGKPFTGLPDDESTFAQRLLEQHPQFAQPNVAPLRDVVIRTMMILADVSFALEQEDYHSAFMFHLIRFNDNVVSKHLQDLKQSSSSPSSSASRKFVSKKNNNNNQNKNTKVLPSSEKIHFFNNVLPELSCASPQAVYMCTLTFGTRLVRAKGGIKYDQEPTDENSEQYSAYLFGLLRSAFLEELIALRNNDPAIRVAYGYSLLELQRYESAQTTLNGAKKMLLARQHEAGSGVGDGGGVVGTGDALTKSSVAAVSRLLACLDADEVIEHTSDMRRRSTDNLRVFEKWHYFLMGGEEGAEKCGSVDGESPKLSLDDLKRSTMSLWPLKNQKVDGTLRQVEVGGDKNEDSELVPLILM